MTLPVRKPRVTWVAHGRDFSIGQAKPVRVVLHDTECHDAKGITEIEGVVNYWWAHPYPHGTRNGAHFVVDEDGNIGQVAPIDHILQHTGGANTGSVGIEQIGFASFSDHAWLQRPKQLAAVAQLLAWLHGIAGIPLELSTSRGVSTHAMQSKIHPESEGHTDPGNGYPLHHVLGIARSHYTAGVKRQRQAAQAKARRR